MPDFGLIRTVRLQQTQRKTEFTSNLLEKISYSVFLLVVVTQAYSQTSVSVTYDISKPLTGFVRGESSKSRLPTASSNSYSLHFSYPNHISMGFLTVYLS